MLPLQMWGQHPLYSATVRLRCAHVAALASFPGIRDSHLLNGHPVTRAEVCGTVTAGFEHHEKWVFYLHDGSATDLQCTLYLATADGTPTSEHRPGAGDTVVVQGKLAMGGRYDEPLRPTCRELRVTKVYAVPAEAAPAHWDETARLHAEVYALPASSLMAWEAGQGAESGAGDLYAEESAGGEGEAEAWG